MVRQHSGAYGMGVAYAKSMFGSAGEGVEKSNEADRSGTAFGQTVTVSDTQPGTEPSHAH